MSAAPSDSLPDITPSASLPRPPLPPKPSVSPPFADNVVRPFTSQGSTSRTPLQLLAYTYAQHRSDERPSSAGGSPMDSSSGKFGPYMSASARTSYTRVDVDSLPTPEYPPLPPLPTVFSSQDVPISDIAMVDAVALPAATATAHTPTNDAPTNDAQPAIMEPPIPQTPQVSLTFLLVTGSRKTQSFEPETTVGRVKELVWNAWPARDADWQDERPPAPSYLRILYLGKILQDDDTLLRVGFPTSLPSEPLPPTIVHLSIRPYAPPSEDIALSKKKRLSVAIGRRLSTAGVSLGVGVIARDSTRESEDEARRAGCCTGCTIC